MVGRKGEDKGFLTKTLDSLVRKIPSRYRRTLTNTVAGLGLAAYGALGFFSANDASNQKQLYHQRPVAESTAAGFDTSSVRDVVLYSPDTSSWRNTPGTDPTPDVYTVVLKKGDTVSEVVEKVRAEHSELRQSTLYEQVNKVARASAELPGQANLLEDVVSAGGVRKQDGIIGDNAKEGQTLVFTPSHTVVTSVPLQTTNSLQQKALSTGTQATGEISSSSSLIEIMQSNSSVDSLAARPLVSPNATSAPYAFAESVLGSRSLPEQQSQNSASTRPGTALVVRDSYLPQRHGAVTADAMEAFMPQYSTSKSVAVQPFQNNALETMVRAESAQISPVTPLSNSTEMPYGILVLGAVAAAVIGVYMVNGPKGPADKLRERIMAGKKKREQAASENATSEPAAEPQPEPSSEKPADAAQPEQTPEALSYIVSSEMPAWKVVLTKRYSAQGVAEIERVIKEYVRARVNSEHAPLTIANLETGKAFYDLYKITTSLRQDLAADAEEFKTNSVESRTKQLSIEDALRKAYRVAAQPEARKSNQLATLSLVVHTTPVFQYVDKETIENEADLFIRRLYDKPLDYKTPQSTDVGELIDELKERESASAPVS